MAKAVSEQRKGQRNTLTGEMKGRAKAKFKSKSEEAMEMANGERRMFCVVMRCYALLYVVMR